MASNHTGARSLVVQLAQRRAFADTTPLLFLRAGDLPRYCHSLLVPTAPHSLKAVVHERLENLNPLASVFKRRQEPCRQLTSVRRTQGANTMCRDEYDLVGQAVYTGSGDSPTLTIVATPNSLSGHDIFGKGVTLRNTTWYVAVYNGLSGTEPLVSAHGPLARHLLAPST